MTPSRPLSLLSPYGEGYCRECCFVVGLGPDGLMDHHTRSDFSGYREGARKVCPGSGRAPAPASRTPVTARSRAFSARIRKGTCSVCTKKGIALTPATSAGGGYVVVNHNSPHGHFCTGSWCPPSTDTP